MRKRSCDATILSAISTNLLESMHLTNASNSQTQMRFPYGGSACPSRPQQIANLLKQRRIQALTDMRHEVAAAA